MAILYGHYQPQTNKWYIGIILGDRTTKQRWGRNGYFYTTFTRGKPCNPKFRNAILKYGWDSFEHKVFFDNLLDTEAKELEKEYILKYNSVKNGYNCTYGGDGVCGIKHSQETRNKLREYAKNDKTRLEKLRKSRIGQPSAISKRVVCVETGDVYRSARNASIKMGLNPDAVKTAIHRNGKCNGYHWKFLD